MACQYGAYPRTMSSDIRSWHPVRDCGGMPIVGECDCGGAGLRRLDRRCKMEGRHYIDMALLWQMTFLGIKACFAILNSAPNPIMNSDHRQGSPYLDAEGLCHPK